MGTKLFHLGNIAIPHKYVVVAQDAKAPLGSTGDFVVRVDVVVDESCGEGVQVEADEESSCGNQWIEDYAVVVVKVMKKQATLIILLDYGMMLPLLTSRQKPRSQNHLHRDYSQIQRHHPT